MATWNVNSVTARLDRLLDWLATAQPDVLALQELKCTDDAFPAAAVKALGYEIASWGTGRWNGVALLSRVGVADVQIGLPEAPTYEGAAEPRAIAATCGGVRVWSLYVPNGREIDHPHYAYKLAWLDCLAGALRGELTEYPDMPLAAVGDFNIAPSDEDVWDIDAFTHATHVSRAERDRLMALESLGLIDRCPRSPKGPPFTFWDYRNGAFHRGWGMRIDLILGNRAFDSLVRDCFVDRDARKGKGASDHAPVIVDLDPIPSSR